MSSTVVIPEPVAILGEPIRDRGLPGSARRAASTTLSEVSMTTAVHVERVFTRGNVGLTAVAGAVQALDVYQQTGSVSAASNEAAVTSTKTLGYLAAGAKLAQRFPAVKGKYRLVLTLAGAAGAETLLDWVEAGLKVRAGSVYDAASMRLQELYKMAWEGPSSVSSDAANAEKLKK